MNIDRIFEPNAALAVDIATIMPALESHDSLMVDTAGSKLPLR